MDDKSRLLRLPVSETTMVQLESALQLHRHQQESRIDRILFGDFSKIASKLDALESTTTDRSSEIPDNIIKLWKLSKEERFWHDLYCVAVPILYQSEETTRKTNTDGGSSGTQKFSSKENHKSALASLTLKVGGGNSGNRMKELRRLVRQARTVGIPSKRSQYALDRLLELRRTRQDMIESKSERASPNKENRHQSKGTVDGISTADYFLLQRTLKDPVVKEDKTSTHRQSKHGAARPSTIEERIQARAKEREENLAEAKAAQKDPREERVAIADALYSYACRVLRKKKSRSTGTVMGRGNQTGKRPSTLANKNRVSSSTTNATGVKKCIVVSFEEVLRNGLAANRSRRDVMRLFSDMVQVLSSSSDDASGRSADFIKWKDLKTGRINQVPISMKATVWIDITDFKKTREVLNREQLPESGERKAIKRRIGGSGSDGTKQRKKAR